MDDQHFEQPQQETETPQNLYSGGIASEPAYRKGSVLLLVSAIIIGVYCLYTLFKLGINYWHAFQEIPAAQRSQLWGYLIIQILLNIIPNLLGVVAGVYGVAYWRHPRKAAPAFILGAILSVAFILVLALNIVSFALSSNEIMLLSRRALIIGIVTQVIRIIVSILYTVGAFQNHRLNQRYY